jgi:hypothetical protein
MCSWTSFQLQKRPTHYVIFVRSATLSFLNRARLGEHAESAESTFRPRWLPANIPAGSRDIARVWEGKECLQFQDARMSASRSSPEEPVVHHDQGNGQYELRNDQCNGQVAS